MSAGQLYASIPLPPSLHQQATGSQAGTPRAPGTDTGAGTGTHGSRDLVNAGGGALDIPVEEDLAGSEGKVNAVCRALRAAVQAEGGQQYHAVIITSFAR